MREDESGIQRFADMGCSGSALPTTAHVNAWCCPIDLRITTSSIIARNRPIVPLVRMPCSPLLRYAISPNAIPRASGLVLRPIASVLACLLCDALGSKAASSIYGPIERHEAAFNGKKR